jgi:hypothetical protein
MENSNEGADMIYIGLLLGGLGLLCTPLAWANKKVCIIAFVMLFMAATGFYRTYVQHAYIGPTFNDTRTK